MNPADSVPDLHNLCQYYNDTYTCSGSDSVLSEQILKYFNETTQIDRQLLVLQKNSEFQKYEKSGNCVTY